MRSCQRGTLPLVESVVSNKSVLADIHWSVYEAVTALIHKYISKTIDNPLHEIENGQRRLFGV